ncbi:cilia- and flagella-associated protein 298 isoform X2 [Microcaecilia unicolor]|uniref:Cilia- and flagella-associated protein 298-A-like isoform X2 n=1 Tax=Microcaecilia unicolor TaxID=1415580 RepID=A0A6P7Y5H2_9AMPH|nr:cilia- and flagella-associated protein 298-A-like isoform X2 [Microcaecilia unicolor]
MVQLHVKRGDESQFLFDTTGDVLVEELTEKITDIYNGRLKVQRICSEMTELADHGITLPVNMQGLTDEQIEDLKLKDEWAEKCVPSGGYVFKKDDIGRRNGQAPNEKMKEVLKKTTEEAKALISKKQAQANVCITMGMVKDALDQLRGAVMIVYPMGLPPHDPIRMEFEGIEDLSGTQKGQGAPAREPVISNEEQKEMMLHYYRRQEELKKLEGDQDDSCFNSEWADSRALKRQFQGVKNIKWRPG